MLLQAIFCSRCRSRYQALTPTTNMDDHTPGAAPRDPRRQPAHPSQRVGPPGCRHRAPGPRSTSAATVAPGNSGNSGNSGIWNRHGSGWSGQAAARYSGMTQIHKEDNIVKKIRIRILKIIVVVYVEIFRDTPMIVQGMVIYYGLRQNDIMITSIIAGILVTTLNTGCFSPAPGRKQRDGTRQRIPFLLCCRRLPTYGSRESRRSAVHTISAPG